MAAICLDAEKWDTCQLDVDLSNASFSRIDQSIAYGALFTAHHLRVKAIAALTESGSTALWMSRNNIDIPILALTPSLATQRKLALYRNVTALELKVDGGKEQAFRAVENLLVKRGVVKAGDNVVLTWGEPMGVVGGTNALKIMKIGAAALNDN
jgi:pyruvate kinase